MHMNMEETATSKDSATLEAVSQPPVQPIIPSATSDTMPATLPATPTSSAPHLHTTQATTTPPESSMFYQVQEEIDSNETDLSEMSSTATTSTTTPTTLSPQLYTTHTTNAASDLSSTCQTADAIDSNGIDLSPALYTTPTTPTTSATASTTSDHEAHSIQSKSTYAEVLNLQSTPTSKSGATSATMPKTSNQQDHRTQMRSIHAGGSDLQITSTPISNSGNDATTSFGTTATTAAMAGYKEITYPKILPLKSVPNWKGVSRIYPLNGQPDPAPATSLATATTTDSTKHDSQAASPTTPLDQTCTSISATSSSPRHLSTLTSLASATPTTLPLDLHIATTAITQLSTSEMSRLSPACHLNVSQPFHPGKLSRNQLPLDMKIEAIRLREEEGLSGRSIMEIMNLHGFKCGKTQVQNILKRKNEWIEQYAQNVPLSRKRKLRKTGNEEINHKVYEWFEEAIDRMIPVNGPMLQQKAVEIARELSITEFKGSNGWLESFRKRHSISFGKVNLGLEGGENPAGGLLPRKSYIFERAKSDPFGNDGKNLTSELPQMIVGEFVKNISSQSSSQEGVTEEKSSPNLSIMEPMFLKKKGNNWCKVKEEDVEKEEEEESQKVEDGGKKKEGKEGRGTLRHLKFKSIHHVAAALREMRIFFATRNYSHLLDSCLDLEEQVALESIAKRKTEEKSTVLDHLNPLDTRPSSNMEQP